MEWMHAAVLYGRRDVRIERVPMPRVEPGQVLVKVETALTCGTDLKVYKQGYHARMIVPPALFGHELAGTVEDVGRGVKGFERGMRVVLANSAPCLDCFFCERDQPNLCQNLVFVNGAYAEYLLAPQPLVERNLLPVPGRVSFREAALMEPLACVLRGLEEAEVQPRDRVLVIGLGPIGLMFVRLCALRGVPVLAVGKRAEQLEKARRAGAECCLLAGDPALGRKVQDWSTQLLGVDLAIEAVGRPSTWQLAIDSVRRGGRVQLFGGCPADSKIALDTQRLHYSEIALKSSFHHTPRHIRQALEIIAEGRLRADDLLTGEATLQELPGIFEHMLHPNGELKTVILPHRRK